MKWKKSHITSGFDTNQPTSPNRVPENQPYFLTNWRVNKDKTRSPGKKILTSPSGKIPGLVDWYITSSNWNVFEPGAAHTKKKM